MSGAPRRPNVDFYRERFPSAAGWRQCEPELDVGGGHLLCLVRHSEKRFDEYVEIYPYGPPLQVWRPASMPCVGQPAQRVARVGRAHRRPVRSGKRLEFS